MEVRSEGDEEEGDPQRRGFWDGVDLHLGFKMQLTEEGQKEREREREGENKKSTNNKYIKIYRIEGMYA